MLPVGTTRLDQLKVAVDVQHLFRITHPRDQGSEYHLADGSRVTEAWCASLYAHALIEWLRARGAQVLTNDPMRGIFVGYYSARQRAAGAWGAHAYLACHLNAGGGEYAAVEYMGGTQSFRLAQPIAVALGSMPVVSMGKAVALSSTARGAVCIDYCPVGTAAVILEPLFGDQVRHQGLLNPAGLALVGQVIGEGVANWWELRRPS